MPSFIIRGNNYEIDAEIIKRAIRGHQPNPIRRYFVEINGDRYPVKQVISIACNILPVSFTSRDAYRILEKVGIRVQSK